jgi:hypothetical protein
VICKRPTIWYSEPWPWGGQSIGLNPRRLELETKPSEVSPDPLKGSAAEPSEPAKLDLGPADQLAKRLDVILGLGMR